TPARQPAPWSPERHVLPPGLGSRSPGRARLHRAQQPQTAAGYARQGIPGPGSAAPRAGVDPRSADKGTPPAGRARRSGVAQVAPRTPSAPPAVGEPAAPTSALLRRRRPRLVRDGLFGVGDAPAHVHEAACAAGV